MDPGSGAVDGSWDFTTESPAERDALAAIGVSVVIPTPGPPPSLMRCLEALAAQRFDPGHFEVIVADGRPTEAARRRVGAIAAKTKMRVRYVAVHGGSDRAIAREAGWRAARGEIVAFTDDDCAPEPGWLAAGLAAFVPGVHGVDGPVLTSVDSAAPDWAPDVANAFYRREALETSGGLVMRRAPERSYRWATGALVIRSPKPNLEAPKPRLPRWMYLAALPLLAVAAVGLSGRGRGSRDNVRRTRERLLAPIGKAARNLLRAASRHLPA
jgi:glycosyltransferase involved in cell wall biosynthesis